MLLLFFFVQKSPQNNKAWQNHCIWTMTENNNLPIPSQKVFLICLGLAYINYNRLIQEQIIWKRNISWMFYPKCTAGWYFTESCNAVEIVCRYCLVLLLCEAEGRKREPSNLHLPIHQHFSEPIIAATDQTNHQTTNYSLSGPPNTIGQILEFYKKAYIP